MDTELVYNNDFLNGTGKKSMIYSHQLENGITLYANQRGDFIEFTNSSTGDHRIDAGSTEERVKAHWEGYVRAAETAYHRFVGNI